MFCAVQLTSGRRLFGRLWIDRRQYISFGRTEPRREDAAWLGALLGPEGSGFGLTSWTAHPDEPSA